MLRCSALAAGAADVESGLPDDRHRQPRHCDNVTTAIGSMLMCSVLAAGAADIESGPPDDHHSRPGAPSPRWGRQQVPALEAAGAAAGHLGLRVQPLCQVSNLPPSGNH